MTLPIALLLALLALAAAAFAREWLSPDLTATALILLLVLLGLLPAEQAFLGFGSDTVVMLAGLFVLTAALSRTGVVDGIGRALVRRTGDDPRRLLWAVVLSAATLSAFISNTAATALFLPVTLGVAERLRSSPSRLLMPLAFASIVTSSVTVLSSSTNIVVSGLLTQYEMAPMGMFELAPVGVPIAVAGVIYLMTLGRRLLPDRAVPDDPVESFGLRPYLSELLLLPGAKLVGKTLAESGLDRDLDLRVVRVVRDKQPRPPHPDFLLAAGDLLLVEGRSEDVLRIKDVPGVEIKADFKLSDPDLQSEDLLLVETLILPRSRLVGRTLKTARFREHYGLLVLALNRHGEQLYRKISDVALRVGDMLLVQGAKDRIAHLEEEGALRVMGSLVRDGPRAGKGRLALVLFAAALLSALLGLLSLPVAVLGGALAVVVTGCIRAEDAYRDLEWRVLVLVGGMLALGRAMEGTGTAAYLAGHLVRLVGGWGDPGLLAVFFLLTLFLTQPMSNQAAAVVMVPIAVQTAGRMGVEPRALVMMIAIAASCSYLTPLEPSCLLVYGPGRYRFMDFLRVGLPLTAVIFVIALLLVPVVWPLRP